MKPFAATTGKSQTRAVVSAVVLAASVLLSSSMPSAWATSPQLGPALQAIDPSQARYDTTSQPSPNPIGQPTGAPVAGQRQPPAIPAGGYQPGFNGYSQPAPGYGYPGGQQPYQAPGGYGTPGYGGAPPQYQGAPGYGGQQYGTPGAGTAPYYQNPGYQQPPQYQAPPQYQQPPSYGGGPPPGGGYAAPPQGGAPGYQQPGYSGAPGAVPGEGQIPEFGKPLPNAAQPGGNGGGWVTQTPQQPAQGGGSDDARIASLEQSAFGSTYPEHETADRVDHLEKECFGAPSTDALPDRLARLEAKLAGSGAFGATASSGTSGSSSTGHSSPHKPKKIAEAPKKAASSLTRDQDKRSDNSAPATSSGSNTTDVQNVVNKIPFNKHAGDFMPAIRRFSGDSVARWTSFPVRIHLPEGSPDSWQHILDDGVKTWGQYIPFQQVHAGEPADIDVLWVNRMAVAKILGITRLQTPEGVMQMQIYLLRPTFYQTQIPEQALSSVFLHELGHAVGLLGHSDKPNDVMYPPENTLKAGGKFKPPSIEPRDLNTLRQIYNTEPIPGGFNLPQPIEWSFSGAPAQIQ